MGTHAEVAKEFLDWQNSSTSKRGSSLLWWLTAFNIYVIQMNISQKHFSEKYAHTYLIQYTKYMMKCKIEKIYKMTQLHFSSSFFLSLAVFQHIQETNQWTPLYPSPYLQILDRLIKHIAKQFKAHGFLTFIT